MEKTPITQPRTPVSSAIRGFFSTAASGALMSGIYYGVTALGALAFGIGTMPALGASLGAIALVGLSTGIFGAAIQAYSAYKGYEGHHAAAYNQVRGHNIAVTAVSNNLVRPEMQQALNTPKPTLDTPALDAALPREHPVDEATRHATRSGASFQEKLNSYIARDQAPTHVERVSQKREADVTSGRGV